MSDDELLEEGKQLRKVVYPKRILGTGPSSFELRLEICRKEWRRPNLGHVEQACKHSQNQNPGKESYDPRCPWRIGTVSRFNAMSHCYTEAKQQFASHKLSPLIREWVEPDDEIRSELLEQKSEAALRRLVAAVEPHIPAINEYLDSFREQAPPEAAVALGWLAESATEARLILENRKS